MNKYYFLIVLFAGLLFTSCSKDEAVAPSFDIETYGIPKSGGAIDFSDNIVPCAVSELPFVVEDAYISDAPFTEGEMEVKTTIFAINEDPSTAQIRLDGIQQSVPPILNVTLKFCSFNPNPISNMAGHIHTQNVNIQPLLDSLGLSNDAVDIRINGKHIVFQLQEAQVLR